MTTYNVSRGDRPVDDSAWFGPDALELAHFQDRGSDHRPRTRVLLYAGEEFLHLHFRVEDQYVRAAHRNYQDPVCEDSCVEFFVQPKPDRGHFNFEMNAGGCLLLYYITDATRTPDGFKKFVKVPWEWAKDVRIRSSLPLVVEPEMSEPVTWTLSCDIPVSLLEHYVGPLRPLAGQAWRANFFKCGDKTSHPHWAMWSPVREGWSFHQPVYFGELRFAR